MKYDLIVIGGGPGGYVAAIRGAQLGKKVALVEKDRVGGTCLNRGCIPTKALMHTAEVLREISNAEDLGIIVEDARIDFAKMHERKDQVVETLVSGVEALIEGNGIDFYSGTAEVIEEHKVKVDASADAIILEGDYIILATGSSPSLPPIPGLDLPGVVTSDDILVGGGIDTDSITIIGGGVIGIEIAGLYNALGAEVTIVEAMDRILPTLDKEISQNTGMILKRRGISINTGATVEKVTTGDNGYLDVVFSAKGEEKMVSSKTVLIAIGRRPNTEGLISDSLLGDGSGKINLIKGFVSADSNCKTGIDSIYAIGDILAGSIQLAHAASGEGVCAVESMFGAAPGANYSAKNITLIPAGVYTDPEIATVGITEAEAKEKGISYCIGKAMTGSNGKTLIESGDRGYVKLVFSLDGDAVEAAHSAAILVGAQIVSKRATDMIGALTIAVNNGSTLKELKQIIWPHPTFSEVIGEAIEDAEGGAIHAMPRRKK